MNTDQATRYPASTRARELMGAGMDMAAVKPRPSGASALRAMAMGALACGVVALGAVAIGRVAIGLLAIGKTRIRRLEVEDLDVKRLRVEALEITHGPASSDSLFSRRP